MEIFWNKIVFFHLADRTKIEISDVAGLGFSGFGRARAFVYRASGGPGFFVSGFGPASGFLKVYNAPIFLVYVKEI